MRYNITLTEPQKNILRGLCMVLLGVLFTWSIIRLFEDKAGSAIDSINYKAELRQKEIEKQLKAAEVRRTILETELQHIKTDIQQHDLNLDKFQSDYSHSYNQLIKLRKDEKNYIPNATTEQQYDFVTKYKYKPIATE